MACEVRAAVDGPAGALKTIEGKLRLTLTDQGGERQLVFVSEDLIDDLLDRGSAQAPHALGRLLRANLDIPFEAEVA